MAVYKMRKKKLQGDTDDGCSAEAMLKGLLKARLRLEHAYYSQSHHFGCVFKFPFKEDTWSSIGQVTI
ncbi:unnamed protein product [Lampetra planeri]